MLLNLLFSKAYKRRKFAPALKSKIFNTKIMKTSNRTVKESKVGTKTLKFGNASSLVWNTKRRYR